MHLLALAGAFVLGAITGGFVFRKNPAKAIKALALIEAAARKEAAAAKAEIQRILDNLNA